MSTERRAHTYRLSYDEGEPEDVVGHSATEAVAARARVEQPVQIMDLTEADEWFAQRARAWREVPIGTG